MKHPDASLSPDTIPFRSPDVLHRMYLQFEQDWVDWLDANMRVQGRRPDGFPRQFRSRWQFGDWLRAATDDEVLVAMRAWALHPSDVEREHSCRAGVAIATAIEATYIDVESALTPDAVKAEGFPRAWRESA